MVPRPPRGAAGPAAPGGTLVVTVPAYEWLWSGHDVVLGHCRRYGEARLRAVVAAAGFTVAYVSHLNALLLSAIALAREWKRRRGDDSHDLARPPAPLNAALARVFALEAAVVPRCPMPCSASLVLIGRR